MPSTNGASSGTASARITGTSEDLAATPPFLRGGGEMGARMRAHDWSTTPLGPPDTWPQSLRTHVRIMLDSRYAMWMGWSSDLRFFFNDAYMPTLGLKRDWALGERTDKVWEEIWPDIAPRLEHVLTQAEATWDEALMLYLERSGFKEETYHTFSYSPAFDDNDQVAGMLCVVTEVTERVIDERRLRVLRDLAARATGAEDIHQCCRHACKVLQDYPRDVPFAAIYLTQPQERMARLAFSTDPAQAAQLPDQLPLDDAPSGWPIAALYGEQSAQDLPSLEALSLQLTVDNWAEPVRQGLLLPLKGAGQDLTGFLLVGCSPRRPLDEGYRSFLNLVAGQLSAALTDAQAYEEERRRAEALAELDRAKTAFFSNVSHEFRTPLTLMLGPLEELAVGGDLSDAQRQRLALILRNAGRLQRLVNALLDFSRLEAGRAQAYFEPEDLAALTRDIASSFRSAMERAGLRFEVDCPALPEPVMVDRDLWEKIVLNLLSNAFKFTLQGGVTLRMGQDGAQVWMTVSDTGIGIAADELPRLFERFHRIAGVEGRTHEGSGIGLALVQELVRLHGGTIAATSEPGQGTTFRLTIPLGQDHVPRNQQRPRAPGRGARTSAARAFVDEAMRWLPDGPNGPNGPDVPDLPDGPDNAPTPFPAAPRMSSRADALPPPTQLSVLAAQSLPPSDQRFAPTFGARILLADDNADMRGYLRDLLAPYYQVEAVPDGRAALEAARRQPPDVILSDVMMPRLDGMGLLAAVRADAVLRPTPVVLLSARAGEESRIEGLDAGADDYLIKPFSARELLARLGALLELRHMRRAAEAATQRRNAQFETLLNAAPIGVFLVHEVQGRLFLREANPAARLALVPPEDHAHGDFEAMMIRQWGPPLAAEIIANFWSTLHTGNSFHAPEFIARRSDRGHLEAYDWQAHRIPLAEGGLGVVCYFREISAHVQARQHLEAADRQKDQFLAMLAHELRNPMAPIRSASDVLMRLELEDPRARRVVGIIQRQVGTLTRLVDDLLDISRITQGRVQLQLSPVALVDVLAQAVETVEPLMRERRHVFSMTSGRPLRVRGDQARLVQCVANLLTNAAKYTDPEGQIQLRMDEDADRQQAVITVTDNGIGIAPDLRPQIFDLFVQGERALDRSQGGLGIGLSLVRRLVEMHQGSVAAFSDGPGCGARFEMRLPLLAEESGVVAPVLTPTAAPRRILVVDDNEDAAASLAMILSMEGHQVEQVHSGADALKHLGEALPDLALLDIGLPGMSGYELAQHIRAQPAWAQLRLIALTGYGRQEDREQALHAGFDAHVVKPADPDTLLRTIAALS
ncbi:ATP-binding protein [Roseateles depolymerans]|uniref:histidine kinase n=1 Tax=Roseateles depolymerans TaxID=76731 RepID=A0A0U3LK75_9BURK|nr:ATP-binding protein [Roseateles depolymerans]ALV06802.1 Multi-sensor hybrid histidine kinase [Roseateles depolymerans]REG19780.1 signal transduction histidine kinase [Roseateles depolymerans]